MDQGKGTGSGEALFPDGVFAVVGFGLQEFEGAGHEHHVVAVGVEQVPWVSCPGRLKRLTHHTISRPGTWSRSGRATNAT
ncbi:MAG: hypothetical protein QG608_3143 [Actinomycetota bacterium]|nr:hypothetical protein [Actinomycetota bacterium]